MSIGARLITGVGGAFAVLLLYSQLLFIAGLIASNIFMAMIIFIKPIRNEEVGTK